MKPIIRHLAKEINFCKTVLLPLFAFTAFVITSEAQTVIVPFGSNWKYFDQDSRPLNWETTGFNDNSWSQGAGQLGYGDGDEATVVACAACNPKYITTYFRKTINIFNLASYTDFTLNVKRDDGVVVYINGTERYANNMPAGRTHATLASGAAADDGNTAQTVTLLSSFFTEGNNVIAVEIHQSSTGSSDISFDLELIGNVAGGTSVTRGPYLQMANQNAVTIRWRTAAACNSVVSWGTTYGSYTNTLDSPTVTTEHIVRISGLAADTKYYYTIGSSIQTFQWGTDNYVLTMPASNSTRKLRFLALGDCGNASANQVDTKNAFLNYIGNNEVDALITLGDNAYSSGLDNEFQLEFFDIYKNDLLKNKKLFTAPGNHDYGNSNANTGVRNNAYYSNFSIPFAGECGGTVSGTPAYYSFDVGNVHFVSLDSYGREDANTTKLYDTSGTQCSWLKNDLAANTKRWTVVYFHHPPYTKTSHNSDYLAGAGELDLVAVRERFIRILERYGVDLVLCGHSHGYERSYLLKNYYNTYASPLDESAFNITTHTATGNNQNAKYDNSASSCPYAYNSGKFNHGSVYVVSGSAGQIGGSSPGYPHNAMYYSNNTEGGCFYFEVDSNRLDAKFISYTGTGASVSPVVRDRFTIFKDVNKTYNLVSALNVPSTLTASWRGTYLWPNNSNAATQSVVVNNTASGTYTYTVRDANTCLQDVFNIVVTAPVPVQLTSFSASLNRDIVMLDWATSQESNSGFYSIEKSIDGNHYSFLGSVKAAGTSSLQKKYHMTDIQPLDGVNYYRLSQTDLDGRKSNLEVKRVVYKGADEFRATFMNIGNGMVNIAIHNSTTGTVSLKVTDLSGRTVLAKVFNNSTTDFTEGIRLQKGNYAIVLMNSKAEKISTKILVD
ncbi:MAG: metallophosphoesterase [Bacteroidetes bacterium]|nr:metallophosphoesterase [Bacteroidota bacterium]